MHRGILIHKQLIGFPVVNETVRGSIERKREEKRTSLSPKVTKET